MTTIACNQTEMACDLQFTVNQVMMTKGKTKIYKIKSHEMHYGEDFIMGFCGQASDIIDVVDFYEHPEDYKVFPKTRNLQGLVLTKSRKIFQFDTPSKWIAVHGKYAAIGSGSPAAYGALHMGASPKEAVLAATKVDPYTGMGTRLIKFR